MWKQYKATPDSDPWFFGDHCDDLEITGGKFHGDRDSWQKTHDGGKFGPNAFRFWHMTNLKVHTMEIRTAPTGQMGIRYSQGFEVYDITMNVTDEHSSKLEE